MRRNLTAFSLLAIGWAICGLLAQRAAAQVRGGEPAARCSIDAAIAPHNRETVDAAATRFVETALGSDPGTDVDQFTAAARAVLSKQSFVPMIEQRLRPMGPFTGLHVAHTYWIDSEGISRAEAVTCEDRTQATAKPAPHQAYVLVEAGGVNSSIWTFVVWLIPEQGAWRVEEFNPTPSGIAGKNAEELWKMAQAEEANHHDFNACVLAGSAAGLANRGPNLHLPLSGEIALTTKLLRVPPELFGHPPYTWRYGGDQFKVFSVGPFAANGQIFLLVGQDIGNWTSDAAAEQRNRALLAGFTKAYPEYGNVFAGVIVEARDLTGKHTFRTTQAAH